jgi:hypothetical protein
MERSKLPEATAGQLYEFRSLAIQPVRPMNLSCAANGGAPLSYVSTQAKPAYLNTHHRRLG